MHRIIDYISNAKAYIYDTFQKDPLGKVINSDAQEQIVLIPNSLVIFRDDFVKVFQKYYVSELFELSNFVLGTYNEPYMFLHLVKKPVRNIKISTYSAPAHLYRDDTYDPNFSTKRLPSEYRADYIEYLNTLDKWVLSGVQPENKGHEREYETVDYSEFNPQVVYCKFYLGYNKETREVLKGENLKTLGELASIIDVYIPSDAETILCKALDPNRLPTYPYLPETDTVKSYQTTEKIHKGDIVALHGESAKYRDDFFLVDKEPEFDVYAPMGAQIIRSRGIVSPEYLFLYLRSKIAWRIRNVLTVPAGDHGSASSRNAAEFPVVLPDKDDSYYQEQFIKIANPDCRFYSVSVSDNNENKIESYLQTEILDSIKLNNENLLRKHIESSKQEIDKCFNAGAYKSVVLLIGSILEAFLLDWISEVEQKDYYTQEMDERDSLDNYIIRLKDRYGSDWPEKSKAYRIKSVRNLIHIKLCIRRKDTISKELCEKLMVEFEEIIQSRYRLMGD